MAAANHLKRKSPEADTCGFATVLGIDSGVDTETGEGNIGCEAVVSRNLILAVEEEKESCFAGAAG